MSDRSSDSLAVHYVLLGSGGDFTFGVLDALIKAWKPPQAFIRPPGQTNVVDQGIADITLEVPRPDSTLAGLLQAHHIPHHIADNNTLAEQIAALKVDFLLVACWPRLLPLRVIQSVSKGALNLHPSLLPRYRGRDPIRDQLAARDYHFGISLHLLNDAYDTGDLVSQQSLSVPDGSYQQIEKACARIGAQLFIEAVKTYDHPGWSLRPQHSLVSN